MRLDAPLRTVAIGLVQSGCITGVVPRELDLRIAQSVRAGQSLRDAVQETGLTALMEQLDAGVERCIESYLRGRATKRHYLGRAEIEHYRELLAQYGYPDVSPGEYEAPTLLSDAWIACAHGRPPIRWVPLAIAAIGGYLVGRGVRGRR